MTWLMVKLGEIFKLHLVVHRQDLSVEYYENGVSFD